MKVGGLGFICGLVLVWAAASPPLTAQDRASATPTNNTTASAAANLIPDGTSVTHVVVAETELWFAARVEAGKSYMVEAMESGRDRTANDIAMTLYESDGVTAFPYADCNADTNSGAPSMQAGSAAATTQDGKRCTVALLTTDPAKLLLIKVSSLYTGPLMVRIRESTVYARYTLNGYNMFVAVHNPSAEPVSGFVVYWAENGTNTSNAWVAYNAFTLSGYGSTQFTRSANSIAAPGNRGHIRIYMTSGTDVHVQAYAFNPTANNYLFFAPQRVNGGSGNSW